MNQCFFAGFITVSAIYWVGAEISNGHIDIISAIKSGKKQIAFAISSWCFQVFLDFLFLIAASYVYVYVITFVYECENKRFAFRKK